MRCNICDAIMNTHTRHSLTGKIEPCGNCVDASKDAPAPLDSIDNNVFDDSYYMDDEDLDTLLNVSPVE